MSNPSEPPALPASVQRVAVALRRAGWICFWAQLVLAVISGIILLFAAVAAQTTGGGGSTAAGTSGGFFFAVAGLFVLGFSTYQAYAYTRLSKRLREGGPQRPSRADTIKQIRITLISNLVGMTLTLIAAEAIGGVLFAKALSQPTSQLVFGTGTVRDFIQPLDLIVVLASNHTILAHFVGIVASIWLIDQIYKQ
ncbi:MULTISPECIES: DUF3611 family protein [Arthrospira]|uniref:DUF3611 family protein n=1 Tax=Limnospira platensis NIES-46 TaxID=1236695 RepID=A0A5M3T6R3_LIMPL|nr:MULTISPECIES: DUF3611 family protein [Arthrospira]AMW31361.1 hypothetical protein AP285_29005 [Arthrospira platensis YZ]KDR57027.1 hypothetical protein APPUASWS_013520 [Arthrospira platensis str. Paraca]MBD2668952.1 DUF3611 family protein [Arthrospira platensis FACHB-439]MBD2709388.1 DUF3611 family protein [Arthrospira platensis FACHB-835]MDF2208839.1 DUF3611 family protein [Arthrospira platensis NCB002]MDT9182122.1 DUF3611 family protein [Limnospira sp. PMC 289.06]MDT9294267.1 DUF3611 fa